MNSIWKKLKDNQKGAIDSIWITVIGIFIAAVLMGIYPLLAVSERGEAVTQLAVQTYTSEFVNKVATTGLVKSTDYDMYVQRLASTGNTYDVEIEVQHLDENQGKKGISTSRDLIGENSRVSTFTSSILESEYFSEGGYPLKKGDIIIVNAKNTNKTIAQLLRETFYKATGQSFQVGASYSCMVVNNGNGNENI